MKHPTAEKPLKRSFSQLKSQCDGKQEEGPASALLSHTNCHWLPAGQRWGLIAQGCCSITLLASAPQPRLPGCFCLGAALAVGKGWTQAPPKVPSHPSCSKIILQSCQLFIINYLTEEWQHCQEACKEAVFYYWQRLPLICFLLWISTSYNLRSSSLSCWIKSEFLISSSTWMCLFPVINENKTFYIKFYADTYIYGHLCVCVYIKLLNRTTEQLRLEITQPKPRLRAGAPTTGCSGLCLVRAWSSSRTVPNIQNKYINIYPQTLSLPVIHLICSTYSWFTVVIYTLSIIYILTVKKNDRTGIYNDKLMQEMALCVFTKFGGSKTF